MISALSSLPPASSTSSPPSAPSSLPQRLPPTGVSNGNKSLTTNSEARPTPRIIVASLFLPSSVSLAAGSAVLDPNSGTDADALQQHGVSSSSSSHPSRPAPSPFPPRFYSNRDRLGALPAVPSYSSLGTSSSYSTSSSANSSSVAISSVAALGSAPAKSATSLSDLLAAARAGKSGVAAQDRPLSTSVSAAALPVPLNASAKTAIAAPAEHSKVSANAYTRYRRMSESRERPGVDPIYWRIEPSGMGNIGLQNAVESLVRPSPPISDASSTATTSSSVSQPSLSIPSDAPKTPVSFSLGGDPDSAAPSPQFATLGLGLTGVEGTPVSDNLRARAASPPFSPPRAPIHGGPTTAGVASSEDLSHLSSIRRLWVGSPGRVNTEAWSANTKAAITKALWECGLCCVPVFLTEEELEGHYNQFCKRILWRPFHYQLADHPKGQAYEELAWRQYVAVNQKFADAIASVYQPNDIVWVNDYHLMLVPAMVRQLIPDAAIGFFLHIPFPSSEIFRCLHVRKQILEGMLGADLIGFQTYSFMRHFLMTCTRILSLESTPKGIQLDKRVVSVGIFPIGINLKVLNEKKKHPEVLEMVAALREKYAGKKVVIGRDKNDYVKGVRQKMLAYERFLNLHPEFVGKVVLIQVALPTTEENELEGQVSDLVARINSKFGSIEYLPVVYLQQDLSFNHYLALLSMADACLITSLRDGMNLTSHEYIACQEKKKSPLIISEFAGTYGSFGSALRVNPWDTREVADAIFDALTMTEDEKLVRWGDLFDYIQKHTAQNYVETFVKEIPRVHDATQHMEASHIPLLELSSVREDFESSTKRIFFLDHDGTLCVPRQFLTPQEIEVTTIATRELLTRLASDPRNFVYLISGRTRESLAPFYGIKNVGLSAENGCFVMVANRARWDTMLTDQDLSWRSQVLEIFEYYTDRTPGSYIEQKEISLVWHFSSAQSSFGSWQAAECQNHIQVALGSTYPIYTLVKKNSIEVMPRNVNKGVICRRVTDYHQSGRSVSRRTSHNFVRDEQNGQVAPLASSGGFMHDGNPSPMPSPVISASDGQTDEGLSPTTPQNMSHSLISSSSPYSSSSPPSHGHAGAHFYQHQHHSPSGASDVSAHTTRMHGTHGPGHGHHNHHRHHTHTSEHSRTRSARGDPIDFIFCIGDDRSDELMFEYVNRLADAQREAVPASAPVSASSAAHVQVDATSAGSSSAFPSRRTSAASRTTGTQPEIFHLDIGSSSSSPDTAAPLGGTAALQQPFAGNLAVAAPPLSSAGPTAVATTPSAGGEPGRISSPRAQTPVGSAATPNHHRHPSAGTPPSTGGITVSAAAAAALALSAGGAAGSVPRSGHERHHSALSSTPAIVRSVYTVTVGSKSTTARWYVPGIPDVVSFLNSLAPSSATSGSAQGANPPA